MFKFICNAFVDCIGYGDGDDDGDGEKIFGCFWWGSVEGEDIWDVEDDSYRISMLSLNIPVID